MRGRGGAARFWSAGNAALGGTAPPLFTDDFNRANENLTANANWTYQSGSVIGMQVSSNSLLAVAGSLYRATATIPTLTANHYVQAAVAARDSNNGWFLLCDFVDVNNYGYFISSSGQYNYAEIVAGGFNFRGSYSTIGHTNGDVIRVELSGSNIVVKRNGTSVWTSTQRTLTGSTKVGVLIPDNFGDASAFRVDNFEASNL